MEINLKEIPIKDIAPDPNQPRNLPFASIDDLQQTVRKGESKASNSLNGLKTLASSILEVGLQQPIIVRPAEEAGKYIIYDGNRRWLAISLLNKQGKFGDRVLCQVISTPLTNTDTLLGQLNVNIQREDFNVFELARALNQIFNQIKQYGGTANIAQADGNLEFMELPPAQSDDDVWSLIESKLGIGRSRRYQIQAVLKLPRDSQVLAERFNLPEGRLRYLVPIKDPKIIKTLIAEMAEKNLSNAQIRKRVKELQGDLEDKSFPKPIQIKSTLNPLQKLARTVNKTKNVSRIISSKDPRTVQSYKKLIPELKATIKDLENTLGKLKFLDDELS